MTELFHKCGGYRRLDSYTMSSIIQLATLAFCRKFLNRTNDPCGRQYDQMTQSARSGVKNLVEGSERMKASISTAINLMDVGRASLCELRDDYTTWLMDHGQAPWRQSAPEAQAVFAVRLAPADYGDDINHDACVRIMTERKRFSQWLDSDDSCIAANALLILINRTVNMMAKQMEKLGAQFREEGGFHERMTTVRVEARREQQNPVAEDAPNCPKCAQPMRLRHGATGEFWGCTAFPTCKGTREVTT
ncbi:MAG TPA: four helix bundle suffix domain-containing protein [Hyphomicrobiaceae bacterium]|nr:four helix bundle suffix domain-containing protein [Hyphomicrobiaceae bacterium]